MKKYKIVANYKYSVEMDVEAQTREDALLKSRDTLQELYLMGDLQPEEPEVEVFDLDGDSPAAEEQQQGQVIEAVYKVVAPSDVMIINNLCEISGMRIEKVGEKSGPMYLKPSRMFSFPEAGEYRVCFRTESDSIQLAAFLECTALKSVTIPKGIVSIDMSAFAYCTALERVVIPEGVEYIWSYAFKDCDHLKWIKFPGSLHSIGRSAFSGCSRLDGITLPENLAEIGERAFSCCRSLTSIEIPEGITALEKATFYGCVALHGVKLPSTLTHIGDAALDGSTYITCKAMTAPALDEDAFRYVETGGYLRIPKGATGYEAWMEQLADETEVIEI